MKWQNKGQEFDALGEKLREMRAVYLFGAGLDGQAVFNLFSSKVLIKAFVDNSTKKQSEGLLGLPVLAPQSVLLGDDEAIIITAATFSIERIFEQLEGLGFSRGKDVFSMYHFFPLWSMYVRDEVSIWAVSFLPSTVCNLKCKHCLNFTTHIQQHEVRHLETLLRDVDLFFRRVDSILIFHVSGGEPLLYPKLAELLDYIHVNYANRIGRIETSTNGTVVPSDDLCRKLRECSISVIVDDYRASVPQYVSQFAELIEKFETFDVSHTVNQVDTWIDLAPFDVDNSCLTDEGLQNYFNSCWVMRKEYRNGKLYLCNYASYASFAGITLIEQECFDFEAMLPNERKALLEFSLGYSDKGYTEFCKRCAGYHNNNRLIPVAVQA